MAAEGLSWLARNGRSRGPRACGVASPGEESLAAAIAARRSRLAVLWPDHAMKRPRGSRARQPCKEKTWQTSVHARGWASRPKEQKPWRTERRRSHPGPGSALAPRHRSLSATDSGAVRSTRLRGLALTTVRLDDRQPPITHTEDMTKARPQLSLARVRRIRRPPPATSPCPVSGGIETPTALNSRRRPSNPAHWRIGCESRISFQRRGRISV
jgi:hypothetical protein